MAAIEVFPEKGESEARDAWFNARLEGLPREAAILVAARAALRVMPLLDRFLIDDIHRKKPARTSRQLLLALFRCHVLSPAASLAPAGERTRFAYATATAAAAAADADASAAAYAAVYASSAAATAAYAAAYAAADAATAATAAFAAATAAFAEDCGALRGGASLKKLATSPLWPALSANVRRAFPGEWPKESNAGGEPPELEKRAGRFFILLDQAGEDFDVWVEFYQSIRAGAKGGRYLFGLKTARALKLLRDVALIENDLWDDPPRLNARFKAMVEAARAEEGEGEQQLSKPDLRHPEIDPRVFDQGNSGGRFVEDGDRLVPTYEASATDVDACNSPSVSRLHPRVVEAANHFKGIASRLDNQQGWTGIGNAAARLHDACAVRLVDLPEQVELIFEGLVEVASFLELDNALQNSELHSNATKLTPEFRRPLEHLVRIAAPWARQFPTIVKLDDEAGAFLARPELKAPARDFIVVARNKNIISEETATRILSLLDAADRGDFQGQKGNSQGVGWAKKLSKAIGYVLAFQLGMVGNEAAPHSDVAKKGAAVYLAAEKHIIDLAAALPADYRLAVAAILEELKKNQGEFPSPPDPVITEQSKRRRYGSEEED